MFCYFTFKCKAAKGGRMSFLSLNFIAKYSINGHQLSNVIPNDTDLFSFFFLGINLRFDKNKPDVEQ